MLSTAPPQTVVAMREVHCYLPSKPLSSLDIHRLYTSSFNNSCAGLWSNKRVLERDLFRHIYCKSCTQYGQRAITSATTPIVCIASPSCRTRVSHPQHHPTMINPP